MSVRGLMAKIRYWDNKSSQWMMRHFYILFFEIVLVVIFVVVFINSIKAIDVFIDIGKGNIIERLLLLQTVNSILIILLILFNSFWMLYIFNTIIRIRSLLRDINFNLIKQRLSFMTMLREEYINGD